MLVVLAIILSKIVSELAVRLANALSRSYSSLNLIGTGKTYGTSYTFYLKTFPLSLISYFKKLSRIVVSDAGLYL